MSLLEGVVGRQGRGPTWSCGIGTVRSFFHHKLEWVTWVRPHIGVVVEGAVASVGPPICGGAAVQEKDGLAFGALGAGTSVLGGGNAFFGENKYFKRGFGETPQLHVVS